MAKGKKPLPANRKLFRTIGSYLADSGEWLKTKSELMTEGDARAFAAEWDAKVKGSYGLPPGKQAIVIVDEKAVRAFKAERRGG